ncbi:MAG: helix-turn-helix domain-containing protein [Spirochaetales bacterium]
MSEILDRILILTPGDDLETIKVLSSEVRLRILQQLSQKPHNVNELADALGLPQSTVATNVLTLEEAGLIATEAVKARKGSQKLCRPVYNEILLRFVDSSKEAGDGAVEVAMPIGLYTNYEVFSPCGLCSRDSVVGYLDVPDSFLSPDRMKAGLLWFEKGWVEYKFPNNSRLKDRPVSRLEIVTELSSETPGTNKNWLSDITLWINSVEVGTWTSPGDFGDRRGKYTPQWWKLEGSQYGLLKNWSVNDEGSYVDGVKISGVTLADLDLPGHHSVKVKIGVKEEAEHLGGMNIFGRGFGNYGQDIILRLLF